MCARQSSRRPWASSFFFFKQKTAYERKECDWNSDVCSSDLNTPGVTAELNDLAKLVEYRPEVMAEALAQSSDMVGYWAGLLMFNRYSHPWTFRMARTAIMVGEFVVMNLKYRFHRPRPSQLSPALMPPITVPGHASYPSGHATDRKST